MNGSLDLIELEHLRQENALQWGSKSSALGELSPRGFPVPKGVCLSVAAFQQAGVDLTISPAQGAALFAAHAARLIQDGDWITLDGTEGTVDLGSD